MIFDITELDSDDTTCPTTTLRDGQKAVVVFDRDMVIRAAFVMADYDMPDMDDVGLSSVSFKGSSATPQQIEQAAGASFAGAPTITISDSQRQSSAICAAIVTSDPSAVISHVDVYDNATPPALAGGGWTANSGNAPASSGTYYARFTVTSSDGTDSETYTFKMEIKAADKISTLAITNKQEITITGTDATYWFKVELKDGTDFWPVGNVDRVAVSGGTATLTTINMAAGNLYRVTVYDVDPAANPTATPVYSGIVAASY